MWCPSLLALSIALTAFAAEPLQTSAAVVTDIRIQGNLLTSDDELRTIAGVRIGMPFGGTTIEDIVARLLAAKRFERVDVLKRFASIADPSRVALVIIVDEGPVRIEKTGDPNRPTRVVRRRSLGVQIAPVVESEDGYGLTYGARLARSNLLGSRSRLSFPFTWGGNKRAAVELDKTFERGPLHRVLGGASIGRRRHPFFDADDDRKQAWVRGERDLVRFVRAGATAGWQRVSFPGTNESFPYAGADATLDTRSNPVLARNAVYARASWEHLGLDGGSVHRTQLEARGYIGLFGQTTLVVRALEEDADRTLPPPFRAMAGGMANLRGFRAGTAVGDTLVSGSAELIVPLTSPLSVGKFGVSVFSDSAAVFNKGERLSDTPFRPGYGGSVWVTAAFVRLSLAVAHGVGASTRVHFGGGVAF